MSRFIVEDFRQYLITDRHLFANQEDLFVAIERAIRVGVSAVQLREKDLSDEEYLPLAHRLREITGRYGARLILNSRVHLVKEVQADGVQLGTTSISPADARKELGLAAIIGYSAHAIEEIEQVAPHVDFVTFSPIFKTPSKAGMGEPQGVELLAEVCRISPVPVIALGGIDQGNMDEVLHAGTAGVAMVRGLL